MDLVMKLETTDDEGTNVSINSRLGQYSTLSGTVSSSTLQLLMHMAMSKYGLHDANRENERVRFEPSRIDRHHRRYGRLEPSHRLASLELRRFGLVLPFGARNDLFNTPNRFLFSPAGKWLQDDLADPLESWSISDVMAIGRKYGVPQADLYGSLYFYLRDQLLSFAERLAKFDISFHIFDVDASQLARDITSGSLARFGVPKTTPFDRIDVSNIIDFEYLGISRVLSDWGPLLSATQDATLIAYFMNWVNRQKGGNVTSADSSVLSRIMMKMLKDDRLSGIKKISDMKSFSEAVAINYTPAMTYYDNSEAFQQYLIAHGMPGALRNSNLKQRVRHTIVPHRIGVPLERPPDALPIFQDREDWYNNVCLGHVLWSERFVEITRA